jgi:hypothetical protein
MAVQASGVIFALLSSAVSGGPAGPRAASDCGAGNALALQMSETAGICDVMLNTSGVESFFDREISTNFFHRAESEGKYPVGVSPHGKLK